MPQHLIIKNNAVSPCTPVCVAITCDTTNPSNYAVTLPAQDLLFNRNQAEATSDLVLNIDQPLWLGCYKIDPVWGTPTGPLELKFTDILADGSEGVSQSAFYSVALLENKYSISLTLSPESGSLPFQDFVGCRYVLTIPEAIVLTIAGGFELCGVVEKNCAETCGSLSQCSTLAPSISAVASATPDLFDVEVSGFDFTGATFAWTSTNVNATFTDPTVNPAVLDLSNPLILSATVVDATVVISWPNGTIFTYSTSATKA